MMLDELAPVPDAALPLPRLREHLRLGSGFADDGLQDALLGGFLRAAIAAVEGRTGKALLERTFRLSVPCWRAASRQPLPVAPVSVVASVEVVDAAGAATALPPGSWRLEPDWARPAVVAPGVLPPVPQGGQGRITFDAGYGPDWDDVPADLGHAAILLAAHYHDHRHDTGLGPGCMPFGVTALIERYRPLRLGAPA